MNYLIGKTIAGRYRVEDKLGEGGMAVVYRVWDEKRGKHLAMKVLKENYAEDHVFLNRFEREAKTMLRLNHPDIVRFYGLEHKDGLHFMLMDFVNGTTLRKVAQRPLTPGQVLWVLQPVCAALHYAHEMGMVHCDVKLANIMLDKSNRVLLADFGIARFSEIETFTLIGAGTAPYMSPEQIKGEHLSPQTDIYALGIVLFELLTGGERPFTGERATITGAIQEKVRWEQLNLPPPSPRQFNPKITPALEAVVMRCLAKDRSKRYKSVNDFLTDLEQAVGVAPEPIEVRAWMAEAGPDTVSEAPKEGKKPLSRPLLYAGIGLTSICIVAGFALLTLFIFSSNNGKGETVVPLPTYTPYPSPTVIPSPQFTNTPRLTATPAGPPPLSQENYQQFSSLYTWEVGSDVVKITGVAISYKTQQVALLVQRYPESYALELRDIEGNLEWETSLVKAVYPAVAFSPDGSLVATGTDDGNVNLWRVADGSLVRTLSGHRFPVRIVAFSPDGTMIASGGSDNTARLWMVAGGIQRRIYDNKTDVRDIAFSNDSHHLAISANVVVVLDATTNESIGNMKFYDSQGDTQALGEVAFSSDGKRIAASGDWFNVENGKWRKRILVWDFPSGASTATRIPIDDAIEDLVFSADGNMVMGVLKDRGKIQIFSIADREVFGEINIGPKLLMSYSPDLRIFAVVSTRRKVTVWGIEQ